MDFDSISRQLMEIAQTLEDGNVQSIIRTIESYKSQDSFNLVVLGEFKRGKSSLINSLLMRDLLPTDVLPTTAILHIIRYSEREYGVVEFIDGRKEEFELNKEFLERFKADAGQDLENIKSINLYCNCDILKDGVVIIDTPGVNDISQMRLEITKEILPYCDAAIFLLDAAAPVTKSEADFLLTQVLSHKIDNILFVISKIDRLDEDEREDAIFGAKKRLQGLLNKEVNVIPYSARKAIEFGKRGDTYQDKENLMVQLEQLKQKAQTEKMERIVARLKVCINLLKEKVEYFERLMSYDANKLKAYEFELSNKIEESKLKFETLMQNIDSIGKRAAIAMFDQHFERFYKKFKDQVKIEIKQQSNVERYVKQILPVRIERELKVFSEQEGEVLHKYLLKFSEHVANEYKKHFGIDMLIDRKMFAFELQSYEADMPKSSNNLDEVFKTYLPYLLGAVVGSFFMPGIGTIIGGVGAKLATDIFSRQREDAIRDFIINNLDYLLQDALSEYRRNAINTIESLFMDLKNTVRTYHENNTTQIVNNLKKMLNYSDSSKEELEKRKANIKNIKDKLLSLEADLQKVYA
ncbi:dynamin family protein [Caldicellulosiruptor acetigenus]|uniref:dynamin family protein n=1 Tax=Caldicellulosiruptor acetigenus TaxID=301953 RepID=UPI0004196EF5|nr:dynamin family protein [Caldicellulosiruptor acetigenus]WAM36933.1 dynamin family protein [Caldicellulosiruptor acetigenus]